MQSNTFSCTWVKNKLNIGGKNSALKRQGLLFYICNMLKLASIKNILHQLKPELIAKYHISSIGLFGSVVRADFNDLSDIDIIVDFSQPIGIEFIDLADYIESKLDKNIDLVSKNGIKKKYLQAIESEILYV